MERWISARSPVRVAYEHAVRTLLEDPQGLLPASDGVVRLAVEVSGGSELGQGVRVTLGVPCSAEGEAWVPIRWEPAGHAHVLPSFTGVVEIIDADVDAELSIAGSYRIPLGVLGRFGDGVVGRRLAQQSVQALVARMAERLEDRFAEQVAEAGFRPAPYPPDLRSPAS